MMRTHDTRYAFEFFVKEVRHAEDRDSISVLLHTAPICLYVSVSARFTSQRRTYTECTTTSSGKHTRTKIDLLQRLLPFDNRNLTSKLFTLRTSEQHYLRGA